MLAGGGRLSLPPGRTAHRPSRCWESPGVHRDEGARCGGGCEIASTAPKPKRKHEDRWPKKKPYTHPPIRWLYAMGAQREELKTASGTAAPMRQAGANPAPNVGLQHLHGHHLYRIHYFSDTYTFYFPSRSCAKPQGPPVPLSPQKGGKRTKVWLRPPGSAGVGTGLESPPPSCTEHRQPQSEAP